MEKRERGEREERRKRREKEIGERRSKPTLASVAQGQLIRLKTPAFHRGPEFDLQHRHVHGKLQRVARPTQKVYVTALTC